MLDRVASLTWRRPKLVLVLVAAVVATAGVLGHDVERHLKAAGFTDSASESERATALTARIAGVRPESRHRRARPGARRRAASTSRGRRCGGRSGRLGAQLEEGAVHPARRQPGRGRACRPRAHREGRRVGRARRLSVDAGRRGRTAATPRRTRSGVMRSDSLDVSIGGFATSFNEVNDQTREDLTKAELIAFPILAVLLLLVFRGVVAAAIPLLIGVISIVVTLLVLRVMSDVRRHLALRAEHRDGAEPGACRRLRAADGVALPGGARARRPDARGAPAHGADGGPDGGVLRPHGRGRDGRAGRPAAALPLLGRRRRRHGRDRLRASSRSWSFPRCWRCSATASTRWPSVAVPPSPTTRVAGTGSRGGSCAARSPSRSRSAALLLVAAVAAALDGPHRAERRGRARRASRPTSRTSTSGALPARRDRGDHGRCPRQRRPMPSSPPSTADRGARRRRARRAVRTRPRRRRVRELRALGARRCRASRRTRSTRSAPCRRPAPRETLVSGNTARFIDQKKSLADHLPLRRRDHLWHDARPAVPAHRLGHPADQDAGDERADARRDARHHRAVVPGGLAQEPVRLHRPGGRGGHEHGVPLRRHRSAWRPTTPCS